MPGEKDAVLSEAEIRNRLEDLPGWSVEDNHLQRRYRTHGWKSTLMVVNTVGHLAEAAWHHPDLVVSYNAVTVRLTNHDAGGITEKDFQLARKFDDVVLRQPGKEGCALTGTPRTDPRHAYIRYE